jgi:CBS domain-containing protein
MRVGDACNRNVVVIELSGTIVEAARRMRAHHVGDLVAVVPERGGFVPVGVLTDRDLVVGVLAKDIEHIATLTVGDVITSEPILAREDEDLSVVLDRMRRNVVRRMPVVNADGLLVGIFTLDDLLGVLAEDVASIGALVSRQRTYEAERRPS